jgi:hypothetical protein
VVRSIYEASYDFKIKVEGQWQTITPDKMANFVKEMEGDGGEVKLTDKVYQNMAIFDRKVVFISLVDPTISRYNRSDIIVKNQNFAQSMAEFFEQSWSSAYSTEEFKNKFTNSSMDSSKG